MAGSREIPRFAGAVLDLSPTAHIARLALVSAYLLGAVVKVADFPGAVAEQAHFGMNPPAFWAALTIAVEVIGPVLILTRRWLWLGAGMLGVFTLLAAFRANAFWTMAAGHDRFVATNAFVEHIGLIGGFILVALLDRREQVA
ncbi:DoxX family protein [Caulobacter sp. 1776]|uniref:DoxX family protein n=1 Tax=Caulobacter sp. 1776 TaxID=3156420 RepID=UPI003398FCBE